MMQQKLKKKKKKILENEGKMDELVIILVNVDQGQPSGSGDDGGLMSTAMNCPVRQICCMVGFLSWRCILQESNITLNPVSLGQLKGNAIGQERMSWG